MNLRPLAAAGIVSLVACGELISPGARTARLTIVPVLDAADPYRAAAASADSLRITVVADSAGIFNDTVAQATAAIDSTGSVNTTINVKLVQSPDSFRIILEALRSADGVIVFAGEDTVMVSAESSSGEGQEVEIAIAYTGPRAARIVMAPSDTALVSGVIAYRVTAFDSLNTVVPGVEIRFFLVNPADSTRMTVNRLTGVATSMPGASGEILVYARTVDSAAYDTARALLGTAGANVRITPGNARVAAGDTLTLLGQVVDPAGNPVAGTVSWTSRNPTAVTVDAGGRITGAAVGSAVVVATATGAAADSVLVTVVTATHAVMAATVSGRAFPVVRVGDTVVVELTADLRYAPPEKLGSFLVTLKWTAAQLQFLDVQPADFGMPVVNALGDSLNVSQAQASSDPGALPPQLVAARMRYRAVAAGATPVSLVVKELSSGVPPLFLNLLQANRVTVTGASVTVRP